MISRLEGYLVAATENTVLINVGGICYDVLVPVSVAERVKTQPSPEGKVQLIIYHYFQIETSRGVPVLIGFLTELEREFFQKIITVSGIGPRAAIKALSQPISEMARAIDSGDLNYLKSLPGIGAQKAKEILAKLQGKVGRFALIQDAALPSAPSPVSQDWQEEALAVLLQLQYKRPEAMGMIQKALSAAPGITSAEDLLNEIYRQKVKGAG